MPDTQEREKSFDDLSKKNLFNLQVFGACSALIVTLTLQSALIMSLIVTIVTAFSSFFISILRNHIPNKSRVICQISIISCLLIVVDQLLKAIDFDAIQGLSIFIGIIITNCLVISHAENFAMKNPPLRSFFNGIRYSLGYSIILVFIATLREFLGTGKLLGFEILPLVSHGGWYQTNTFFTLPASAMFLLALLIGIVRTFDKSQIEEPDFTICPNTKGNAKRH